MGAKKKFNLNRCDEKSKKNPILVSDIIIIILLVSGLYFMYLFNKQTQQIEETLKKNNAAKIAISKP